MARPWWQRRERPQRNNALSAASASPPFPAWLREFDNRDDACGIPRARGRLLRADPAAADRRSPAAIAPATAPPRPRCCLWPLAFLPLRSGLPRVMVQSRAARQGQAVLESPCTNPRGARRRAKGSSALAPAPEFAPRVSGREERRALRQLRGRAAGALHAP